MMSDYLELEANIIKQHDLRTKAAEQFYKCLAGYNADVALLTYIQSLELRIKDLENLK